MLLRHYADIHITDAVAVIAIKIAAITILRWRGVAGAAMLMIYGMLMPVDDDTLILYFSLPSATRIFFFFRYTLRRAFLSRHAITMPSSAFRCCLRHFVLSSFAGFFSFFAILRHITSFSR